MIYLVSRNKAIGIFFKTNTEFVAQAVERTLNVEQVSVWEYYWRRTLWMLRSIK